MSLEHINVDGLNISEITQLYHFSSQAKAAENPVEPLRDRHGRERSVLYFKDETAVNYDTTKISGLLTNLVARLSDENVRANAEMRLGMDSMSILPDRSTIAREVARWERLPGAIDRTFAIKQLRMFESMADQKSGSGFRCVRLSNSGDLESAGLWMPLFRSDKAKDENDAACQRFKEAVSAYYGGEGLIPDSVQNILAGLGENGDALSAKRIKNVCNAMRAADKTKLEHMTGGTLPNGVSLGTLPLLNALASKHSLTPGQCAHVARNLQEKISANPAAGEDSVLTAIGYKDNVDSLLPKKTGKGTSVVLKNDKYWSINDDLSELLLTGKKVILEDGLRAFVWDKGDPSSTIHLFNRFGGEHFMYQVEGKKVPQEVFNSLFQNMKETEWKDKFATTAPSYKMSLSLMKIPVMLGGWSDVNSDKRIQLQDPAVVKPSVVCSEYDEQKGTCQVKISTRFTLDGNCHGTLETNAMIDEKGGWALQNQTLELD